MNYNIFINQNQKCPKCSNKIKYNVNEVKEKILKKCINFNYTFLNFDNDWSFASYSRIKLKCNKDDYIWSVSYNNFINQNKGCPKCANKTKFVIPFKKKVLEKLFNNIIEEKTYSDLLNIKPLRYDFFIPKLNLLIELNGVEHYNKNYPLKDNYLKKINYTIKNNINFIEIPNKYYCDIQYFINKLKELNI